MRLKKRHTDSGGLGFLAGHERKKMRLLLGPALRAGTRVLRNSLVVLFAAITDEKPTSHYQFVCWTRPK